MPHLTLPQTQVLLAWAFALPPLTAHEMLALLTYRQTRNWAAYQSHRKRRLKHLENLSEVSL